MGLGFVRYVNCQDMAKEACDAVRDGRLEIVPPQFKDTWFRSEIFLYATVHLKSYVLKILYPHSIF